MRVEGWRSSSVDTASVLCRVYVHIMYICTSWSTREMLYLYGGYFNREGGEVLCSSFYIRMKIL